MNFFLKSIMLLRAALSFNHFKQFSPNEIKEIFKENIIYTNLEIMKCGSASPPHGSRIDEWRRKNANFFDARRFAHNYNDKCFYLGWINNFTNTRTAFHDHEHQIYCILDIQLDKHVINFYKILENPKTILNENDIKVFNNHLISLKQKHNMTINLDKLKTFDNGRWYMNLLYIK